MEEAYTSLYGNERIGAEDTLEMRKARPLTDKWTFSTNGVSIMGRNGIPCIGFGPGAEAQAHVLTKSHGNKTLLHVQLYMHYYHPYTAKTNIT